MEEVELCILCRIIFSKPLFLFADTSFSWGYCGPCK